MQVEKGGEEKGGGGAGGGVEWGQGGVGGSAESGLIAGPRCSGRPGCRRASPGPGWAAL